jgi:hypothetical protein
MSKAKFDSVPEFEKLIILEYEKLSPFKLKDWDPLRGKDRAAEVISRINVEMGNSFSLLTAPDLVADNADSAPMLSDPQQLGDNEAEPQEVDQRIAVELAAARRRARAIAFHRHAATPDPKTGLTLVHRLVQFAIEAPETDVRCQTFSLLSQLCTLPFQGPPPSLSALLCLQLIS